MSETKQNPLIGKLRVVDGLTVTLPSGGLLYDEGVLSPEVKDGEIRVYPMTTREEILLRSADGLYGGTAINRVLARCVPEVLDMSRLFFNDVDYLMVALRNVSYGSSMDIEYQHTCEKAKKPREYTIDIERLLKSAVPLDPLTATEQYEVLTSAGQLVALRPVQMLDMMEMLQPRPDMTDEEAQEAVFTMYMSQIRSVDGHTDRDMIYEWLEMLPTNDLRTIKSHLSKISDWGVNYQYDIKCKDCGETVTITTPINPVTFFS